METSFTYTVTPLSGGSSLVETSEKAMFILPAGSQDILIKERTVYLQEIGVWKPREPDQQGSGGKSALDSDAEEAHEHEEQEKPVTHMSQHGDSGFEELQVIQAEHDFVFVSPRQAARARSPTSPQAGHKRTHSFTEHLIKVTYGKRRPLKTGFGACNLYETVHNGDAAPVLSLPPEILAMFTTHLLEDVQLSHAGYYDSLVIKNNVLVYPPTLKALAGLGSLSGANKHLLTEVRCNFLSSAPFHYSIQGHVDEHEGHGLIWSGIEAALPTEISDSRSGSSGSKSTLHSRGLVLDIKCNATAATTSDTALDSLCERIKLCTNTKDLIVRWNFRADNWYQESPEDDIPLRAIKETLQVAVEQMRSVERYHIQVERLAIFASRGSAEEWTGEGVHRVDLDDDDYWMGNAKLNELKWDLHAER